jgi:hypothetical protein
MEHADACLTAVHYSTCNGSSCDEQAEANGREQKKDSQRNVTKLKGLF